jgi:hypothetical protein
MKVGESLCVVAALVAFASASASAALEFSRSSDSLYIQGSTPLHYEVTIDAVVKVQPQPPGPSGRIFNEWAPGSMDIDLGVWGSGFWGFIYPTSSGGPVITVPLTPSAWHEVSFVFDGVQTWMYVDGQVIQHNSASGVIGTSPMSISAVGAIFRDGYINPSFVGDIQSLRISGAARYLGNSFTPTLGDLPSDLNTLLLYNFDEPANPSDVIVPDLSGNQRTGVLGVGFVGATSPQWVVPEPSAIAILFTAACLLRARRRSRSSPDGG